MGGQKYDEPVVGTPVINMPEIRKVLAHIEGDMRRLEMRKWGITKEYVARSIPKIVDKIAHYGEMVDESEVQYLAMLKQLNETGWAECNARACFAGWQVLLSTPREQWSRYMTDTNEISGVVREQAQQAFGFTEDESYRVFLPPSTGETSEAQLTALKREINSVLEKRGMTERV